MSIFNNYDDVSQNYDAGRNANGVKHYLGIVYSLTGKTADKIKLGDFGCGTGNHAKYLLDKGTMSATLFDANDGMLANARKKLEDYDDKVTIEKHNLPKIPYEDESFDLVTYNQVIHHLDNKKDGAKGAKGSDNKNGLRTSIDEAYRVLKTNSVLIINSGTPKQYTDGIWFSKIFPNAEECSKRMPEPEDLIEILKNAGFEDVGMLIEPLDTYMKESEYFREDGVSSPEWRAMDSMMSSAPAEAIQQAENMVRNLKESGKMKEFMQDADKERKHIGQYNIYYAKKM